LSQIRTGADGNVSKTSFAPYGRSFFPLWAAEPVAAYSHPLRLGTLFVDNGQAVGALV